MYELVKKKSTATRIILGVLILFVITSMLKIFFAEPEKSINEELMKMASEINKHAPIIVDSTIRFDNAVALTGNKFQYNYTLLTTEKSNFDTTDLIVTNKQVMINRIKTNPKLSYFVNNKIDILGTYFDKNGVYLCTVTISHDEYK